MTTRQNNKPQRCLACDGTGHPLVMGEEKCNDCMGTGRDTRSDLWGEHCKNCNGRGKVAFCRRDYRPCRECGGLGVLHPRGMDPDGQSQQKADIPIAAMIPLVPLVNDTTQLIEMTQKDGFNTAAENKVLDILWGVIGGTFGFIVGGPVGAAAGTVIGSKVGPRRKPRPPITITVKDGETLSSIAKRVFGNSDKWHLIYNANRDKLTNPNNIRVGMQLLIVYD